MAATLSREESDERSSRKSPRPSFSESRKSPRTSFSERSPEDAGTNPSAGGQDQDVLQFSPKLKRRPSVWSRDMSMPTLEEDKESVSDLGIQHFQSESDTGSPPRKARDSRPTIRRR